NKTTTRKTALDPLRHSCRRTRPSQSTDLNIIENLWCELKRAVHARKPSNLNELEKFCKEEWSKIPSTTIQTLIGSYRKRLEAVISAKGGSTKYRFHFLSFSFLIFSFFFFFFSFFFFFFVVPKFMHLPDFV
uniref:Tc1-like transposase DDE domain-containing protein n=1 Tax=Astatotilapia calliptera TaxID=8154 RepID=A0AAX7U5C3_ASTCA